MDVCCCRAGLSGAGLTDFADDVADIVAANAAAGGGKGSSLSELYRKHRLSQQYGADLATQQTKVRCCCNSQQVEMQQLLYDAQVANVRPQAVPVLLLLRFKCSEAFMNAAV